MCKAESSAGRQYNRRKSSALAQRQGWQPESPQPGPTHHDQLYLDGPGQQAQQAQRGLTMTSLILMGQGSRGIKFHTLIVNWREKGSTHLQARTGAGSAKEPGQREEIRLWRQAKYRPQRIAAAAAAGGGRRAAGHRQREIGSTGRYAYRWRGRDTRVMCSAPLRPAASMASRAKDPVPMITTRCSGSASSKWGGRSKSCRGRRSASRQFPAAMMGDCQCLGQPAVPARQQCWQRYGQQQACPLAPPQRRPLPSRHTPFSPCR
jgi:hypothetical protein